MAIKYLTSIDLSKNELQNVAMQNLAVEPSTPVTGQFFWDTAVGAFKIYSGTAWVIGGLTAQTLGTLIYGMDAITIADGDLLTAVDITDTNKAKKIAASALRDFFKTTFDTVYMPKVTAATGYNLALSTTAADIKMNGVQALGSLSTLPRADHVHPIDTSRAAATHGHPIGDITGVVPLIQGGTAIAATSNANLLNGLGFAYADCATAGATAAKTVTLSGFVVVLGGIVAVKFANAVPAAATLNINGTGAFNIKYAAANILVNYIDAGAIALLQYDGAAYNLLNPMTTCTDAVRFSKLGFTSTVAELNFTDGVTSAIQPQLNAKAPLADPAFTGNPTAPTPTAGDNDTSIATTAFVNTAISNNAPAETQTTLGALINAANAKTTPIDADMLGLMDSNASNILTKLSWLNVKATLKTYFDGLYATSGHVHSSLQNSGWTASLPTLTAAATIALTSNIPAAYTSNPAMDGVAAAGSSAAWAKGDHVHPSDTNKLDAGHAGTGGAAHADVIAAGASGFMTGADKTKLNGIEAGAQVNDVTSVAGRTGAVVLTSADIGLGNVTNNAQVKANPTATAGAIPAWVSGTGDALTNGYTVATDLATSAPPTALVRADAAKAYADGLLAAADAMIFKGTVGAGGMHTIAAFNALVIYNAGWAYKVIEAGTIKGNACQIGDLIIATVDRNTTGAANTDWVVTQTNIDGAVVGPASSTMDNFALFDGVSGKLIKDAGWNSSAFASAGHNHNGTYTKKYATSFGILNTADYDITHNLGTLDVMAQCRENATGDVINCAVKVVDVNIVRISLSPVSASFPTANQFRVVVTG